MAKILNNILCTLMVFLLAFAWTVYCLKDLQMALLLATVVATCACYIIFVLQNRTEKRRNAKKIRKKKLTAFATFLQFNADNSAIFSSMFCYYNFITEYVDFDNIIISKQTRIFVSICYQTEAVSASQIQQAVVSAKRNNCRELMVFGCRINPDLTALANTQIPTRFVDTANAYFLFEQAEKLPNISEITTQKSHFLPQFAFSKKRFGWYLAGAIYSLAISFFSFLKLYLLIWATAMFLLALYSLLNKRYNHIPTDVSLG